MNKTFFSKYLPLILLAGLLLAGLVTIFTQADNYGIAIDESSEEQFGHAIWEWYATFGKDQSFLTAFPTDAYVPEHGYIFDALITAVELKFPSADHWHVRRIIIALSGLLGILAIALCGYELGGCWVAFLAALALWLYPRYYGVIYNDAKDVPAAVTTMFVLWVALLLMKQWDQKKRYLRNSILVGFCIGLAASIRVTAVIWYLILGLIALAWWLLQGKRVWQEKRVRAELVKQGISTILIGITSLLTMMAFWPYIFLNPIRNLFHSIKVMSQYPWNGTVLYNGVIVPAMHLPRTYAPEWLVIGSPPMLIIFALLGFGIACVWSIKKRIIDPKIALVILSFVVPLGAIVGLHSVLYDALRQFLFLVPSMILIAVYGFVQIVAYLGRSQRKQLRWAVAGLAVLTLASYALVAREMIELSPFEYTYFSPVVGGLPGAAGKFETDYWGTCTTQARRWLVQNYQQYTGSSTPSVEIKAYQYPDNLLMMPGFHEDDATPNFYIATTRYNLDQAFPTYKVIHIVAAEGVALCVVKVDPTLQRNQT
jgi:hypothetical protein